MNMTKISDSAAICSDMHARIKQAESELMALQNVFYDIMISRERKFITELFKFLIKGELGVASVTTQLKVIQNELVIIAGEDMINMIAGYDPEKVRQYAVSFIITTQKFIDDLNACITDVKKEFGLIKS